MVLCTAEARGGLAINFSFRDVKLHEKWGSTEMH